MGWVFLVFAIILFALAIFAAGGQDKRTKKLKEHRAKWEQIAAGNGFKPTWKIERERKNDFLCPFYVFSTDDVGRKCCYFDGGFPRFFSYGDIVKVELLVDDTVKVSKKAPSVGKAIAGGVIAGVPGAVVGSMLGKTETKAVVSSVTVKVLLKDSTVEIRCLKEKSEDYITEDAMLAARQIVDKLTVVMAQTCK